MHRRSTMRTKQIVTKIRNFTRRQALLFATGLIVFGAIAAGSTAIIRAESISELQEKSRQLEAEISANKKKAASLHAHAGTLQGRIDELNGDIATANRQIELLSVKIRALGLKLEQANKDLEKQKELLRVSMRALYKRAGPSTVELLVASDSFSEFINDQEYLERLKTSIQDSAEKVVQLKAQIEAEKAEQEELKQEQEGQRNVLASKRQEQQRLLNETRGEEARYKSIIAQQQKELEAAEERLTRLLYSGNVVSLGPVSRGQKVGSIGSTGYSTGPHLHFMVKHNGQTVNPSTGGTGLINGYTWPVPNFSYISTPYGYIPCQNYTGCYPAGSSYSVFHSGLDIAASYYSGVYAAADGEIIFRGCSSGLGYVVAIDHGNGWQTWYPHMVTPGGQTSGYCG